MFGQANASEPIEALVGKLHALASTVAERLDPDEVPANAAAAVYERLDRIVRMVTAARTLVARRVADGRAWEGTAHHSAAELLAAVSGTSLGAAKGELETSEVLRNVAAVRAGLCDGSISPAQGAVIADAAKADPAAADGLIEAAGRSNLTELRQAAGRVKAAADTDLGARHERIRRARRCSQYTEADGTWVLMARGTAEAGAVITAALEPLIDELYRTGHTAGAPACREAYAFDALEALARRAVTGAAEEPRDPSGRAGRSGRVNPRYLGLLRVDVEALQRGRVDGSELCELTGIGPIPVDTARRLLGDAVLKLVVTKGVDVAHVTHLGRGPNAAQRVALAWRSLTCTVEGCSRTHLEWDHRIDHAITHHTRLDELDGLCDKHHDQKTYQRWALVAGTGKRPFVPPDHPDHPGHLSHHGRQDQPGDGRSQPAGVDPAAAQRIRARARAIADELVLRFETGSGAPSGQPASTGVG